MKRIKSILPIIFTIIAVLIFSASSDIVSESVRKSLQLCYDSVIPSLLPFFILCDFLMQLSSCIGAPANFLAFGSGLITGFPTGVKNVCTLYQKGYLERKSAVALLHCTANASPAYIIAFIGVCIIHNKDAGIVLLISQSISAVVCALFFGAFKKSKKRHGEVVSITEAACFAVTESVTSCLYVCGYIIFFGIFADIILSTGITDGLSMELKAIIIGAIEISRGLSFIDFESRHAIVTASVILAFSGVSVIMQCIGCTVKAGLPARAIITGKLCYMILMPGISYILFSLHKGVGFFMFIISVLLCAILIYIIFDKSKRKLYNR